MRYVIIKYDKLIVKDYRALEEVKKSRLKPKVTPGKKKIRNDLIEEKPKKKKKKEKQLGKVRYQSITSIF